MNQKKARMLRKKAGYDPGEDPINERQYSTLLTVKSVDTGKGKIARTRTGHMLATKGERLIYRIAKKMYKEGKL